MGKREATFEEWKELYDAAVRYKELSCWEWMNYFNVFGVQNVETGEMGYCCVLGSSEDVMGLSVYVGEKGLKSYLDTLFQAVPPEDVSYIQDCITLSFEDREALNKKDLDKIKELGFKFRGRRQWPQFRNCKPGYFPWYINGDEVRFMKCALEQAIDVAKRCKEDKDLVEREDDNEILARVPHKKKGSIVWEDKFIQLELDEEDDSEFEKIDELALKRIKDSKTRKIGIWEIDFFHAPAMVNEGDRPYFPLVFLVADGETGIMMDMIMTSDFEGYIKEFQDAFVQLLAKIKVLPDTIVIQRKDVFMAIEPITRRVGIKLEPVEELIVVEDFRRSLEKFL